MIRLGFIGAGKVGTALAVRLAERGYDVTAVNNRSPASARRFAEMVPGATVYNSPQEVADSADLIFLTTPDDAIAEVASRISWSPGKMVVHCSGAASLDVLEIPRQQGALVGAFHPLQTFANIDQALANLPGSYFAIEAEGKLKDILKEMAQALEGQWVELKAGDKELYHLSAVMACNYLVTLVNIAAELWRNFGRSPREAVTAMLPLLRGTVNNLSQIGLPGALTGPIARGDVGTIKKHLQALERSAPQLLSLYRELGRWTIPIGVAKGTLTSERAEELAEILRG